MREPVKLQKDGYAELKLEKDRNYIVTKWYGSSLAVFEEAAFQKYIRKLDTLLHDGNHGKSVIQYFLSAAVTMLASEGEGWQLPEVLVEAIAREGEAIVCEMCTYEDDCRNSMPIMLLAAESNMDSAVAKTAARHQE